jgi:hypothetical protein
MPEQKMAESRSEFFKRYVTAIAEKDFATLEQMIHPDYVGDYPQSGERFRGFAGYTVLPLAGPERYTTISRAPYPDGSRWWVVSIITLRDEKVIHAETFFAPEFDPPEWRRDIVEVIPRD